MMVLLCKYMNITLWNFGIATVLYNFRSFYSMMRRQMGAAVQLG